MKISPANFRKLINAIAAGLANVVTASLLRTDYIVHIHLLFESLKAACLVVNLHKCKSGKSQVLHLVERGSVRPRQAKLQAIAGLPPYNKATTNNN